MQKYKVFSLYDAKGHIDTDFSSTANISHSGNGNLTFNISPAFVNGELAVNASYDTTEDIVIQVSSNSLTFCQTVCSCLTACKTFTYTTSRRTITKQPQ